MPVPRLGACKQEMANPARDNSFSLAIANHNLSSFVFCQLVPADPSSHRPLRLARSPALLHEISSVSSFYQTKPSTAFQRHGGGSFDGQISDLAVPAAGGQSFSPLVHDYI